jgi:iron complex outermembrane receptor protein
MRARLVLGLMLLAAPAAAQPAPPASAVQALPGVHTHPAGNAGSARLMGIVTAPDEARLPGATVTIANPATGWSVAVVTAGHGAYSASGVPAGDYDVTVELAGFQRQVVRVVSLSGGEDREVDVRLKLSSVVETVTVEGSLPRDSIESSGIRDSSARDIGEALGRLNGMAMVRKGGIANDVVLNGHQSRNLTVLIDGERIHGACPNGMDPAVFHADFAEVDHLEIAKGPFDMRHQGSLGGLVNVVTRAPGKGFHGTPSVSAGSWGYINPAAVASWGTASVSMLGGFSFRRGDAYRDGAGALFTEYANYRPGAASSQAFDAGTAWARAYFSPRPNHSAHVSYTRQQADDVLYPYLLMDGITDRADRVNLRYGIVRDGSRLSAVSARAFYSAVDHWMTDAFRLSSAGAARDYGMATDAHATTAGAHVDAAVGSVTAGVEAFRRSWDATTSMAGSKYVPQYSIPFATTDSVGAFADYEQDLGSRTTLAAGGRVDYSHSAADAARANTNLYFAYNGTRAVAASDAGVSGKFRVTRQFGSSLNVQAGVGHTYRIPDLQERYFALRRMGTDWVGNPALRPTRNTGLQLGATYRVRRALASVSVSREWVADFITVHGQRRLHAVPGIMNPSARSYANVDARLATAEFSLTAPITDRLFVKATGAATRGTKNTDPSAGITDADVAEIPPASGTVSLRYDRASGFAEAQTVFAAGQGHVDGDLQESPTPGYGVLNLRAGMQIQKLRLTLALDNVFDRLYVHHNSFQRDPYRTGVRVPEPGRNLSVSLSYWF